MIVFYINDLTVCSNFVLRSSIMLWSWFWRVSLCTFKYLMYSVVSLDVSNYLLFSPILHFIPLVNSCFSGNFNVRLHCCCPIHSAHILLGLCHFLDHKNFFTLLYIELCLRENLESVITERVSAAIKARRKTNKNK